MIDIYDKAIELRECANAWEPGARLLGNVRADEIIGILDAYEKRIAELEAELEAAIEYAHSRDNELARVKAESLRVVRVKSENEINFGAFVRHIFLDGKFVRLERWEEQG